MIPVESEASTITIVLLISPFILGRGSAITIITTSITAEASAIIDVSYVYY